MGIYSHETTADLIAKRQRLSETLELRLTGPSRVSSRGNSSEYNNRSAEYQNAIKELRAAIGEITAELAKRGEDGSLSGSNVRRPIYLVC